MSSKNFLQVKAAIYEMGLLFNQMPSDERITAYARALENYEPRQVIFAFKLIIESGSAFFPSLAEILKCLKPITPKIEDRAPVIVAEIITGIRRYGKWAEKEMLESLSPEARAVVYQLGDTTDIRNSENFETTKAQLERLAKGVLGKNVAEIFNTKLEAIGITTQSAISINKSPLRKLGFSQGEK